MAHQTADPQDPPCNTSSEVISQAVVSSYYDKRGNPAALASGMYMFAVI